MTPLSTSARRALRLFRQRIHASADRIEHLTLHQPAALSDDIDAWYWKKGVGRQRAEARIKRRFPGVRWHRTSHPVLLGAYLCASDIPLIASPTDPGEKQTSVMVHHFMLAEDKIHLGPWTLEVPDHAIGRIAERAPHLDIESVFWGAHEEALALAERSVPIGEGAFLLATPGGAFMSEFHIGAYQADEQDRECIVRPRTWLDQDQLHDDQTVLPRGEPTLGATFLLPRPARRLRRAPDYSLRVLPNHYALCLDFFLDGNPP